jgi:hypothetical protein
MYGEANGLQARMTKRKSSAESAVAARIREAGERARAEAEARRAERDAAEKARPAETGGQKGPEPTRYGDWEHNGIISDF